MSFLLLTPPLTQLNTPYPATTVLKGFLQEHGQCCWQTDLGIELVDAVFSPVFLTKMFDESLKQEPNVKLPRNLYRIHRQRQRYIDCIRPVLDFLRGNDLSLATRIATRNLLPEGPRFDQLADTEWAFGTSGTDDLARHLATLFIEDLADYIRETTDPHFDLIRYAEQLASYAPTFDPIEDAMRQPLTAIDIKLLEIFKQHVATFLSDTEITGNNNSDSCTDNDINATSDDSGPRIVCFTIPFPGCLYGALRCGQWLREHHPEIITCLGGGFVNTEWRSLADPRIFQYCQFITLDDGELPLLHLAEQLGKAETDDDSHLIRTYYLKEGKVHYSGHDNVNLDYKETGTPDFEGLPLHLYISMAEMINPMQRLWSNGRWNKMMMAHGCYWHGCAFCDTKLDYIGRYSTPSAEQVVDRMQHIALQTGISGFHFVDEAVPPQLLREVCQEILKRHFVCSFWGNIRFEKVYTQELCDLMSAAGCVAVSGGLEVASDRLLQLIHKGVTIEQTVQVCRHFKKAGILVHTYLMYGFPTETLQESINALETVRRLFAEGLVQSAFWHRYAMTCHSPSGCEAEKFGARRKTLVPNTFCNNEVDWEAIGQEGDSPFPYDIDAVGEGLRFALYNYMNGIGFDTPLHRWFSIPVPKPKAKETY